MTPTKTSRCLAWLTLAAFFSSNVLGAAVDLASVPLVSMSTKVVRPNVMFILDDSGSMDSQYMPDSATNSGDACWRNFGYNKIYYNPNLTYEPPKNADGSNKANASVTAAYDNGFNNTGGPQNLAGTHSVPHPTTTVLTLANNSIATNSSSGGRIVTVTVPSTANMTVGTQVSFAGVVPNARVNNIRINGRTHVVSQIVSATVFRFDTSLSTNDQANATGAPNIGTATTATFTWNTYTNEPNAFYYNYTANVASPATTCEPDASYTQVLVSSLNATQQQNFANWYSYYRTRLMMMKSAAGRAFVGVDDKFRVGFTTISETGTTAARWLGNAKFDATQKSSWYSKFYGASTVGYTPLRGALSKAGRYYAGTLVTGNNDPVQYSCQKNFTILTTDGYWNKHDESSSYGPKREDNVTDVGDQDSDLATSPRPMYESGAYSNTLADVARYYYKTDLRTTTAQGGLRDDGVRTAVNANIQDNNGVDLPDGHQHMKTLTLGLGMSGVLAFPGDDAALKAGTVNWPDPQTGVSGDSTSIPARLDDLWHAGINGGGTYASASDPEDVVDALRAALATIVDQEQTGASAATSSLEPVAGDNYAYVAQYTTARWNGDIEARTIDLSNGTISGPAQWSAQAQLDATVDATTDTRNIYTWNSGGTARVDFTLASVNAASFGSTTLSQYGGWNAAQKANATADALVRYVRGQHDFEMRNDATHTDLNKRLFRQRDHAMGDIINSSPVYVKKPPFRYADSGYAAFVGAQASRSGTVYVGANDGMLHAFDATTGAERWSYIPRMLHSELFKLADANYSSNHRYYVDGVITVGDAWNGSSWRTVLIAGLGGGGKGYFALDVTDPTNPSVLWEYTNNNLGYAYGNPILTKRAVDGSWVVLFASGYNNTTGDSQGRLFMVNAFTGANIGSIQTSTGNNPNLSGIAKINSWVLNTLVDNTTQYVYGGDLSGNLWRFDINTLAAQKLGQTSGTPGALPITARPELARIRDAAGTYHRVVYFGTGRYLGANDVSGGSTPEVTAQVMMAIKDTGTDLGTFTAVGAGLVQQTLDIASTPRRIPSPQPVNWASQNGWYINMPVGERVTIDPRLQLGTVAFVANKPVDDYCALGGSSWLYALDYKSGGAISTQANNIVGFQISDKTIATGLTLYKIDDTLYGGINTNMGTDTEVIPTDSAGAGVVRRVGYREIN